MGEVRCRVTVGRSDEIELLAGVVAAARRRQGSVTFVLGEAGAGKTRLVAEATARARDADMASVRGRAAATAVPAPYRPFSEAFLDGFRTSGPPALGEAGYLRSALGLVVPSWADPAAPPPAQPTLVLLGEATVALLEVLARPAGALVVLEDLHWADPESLALLDYLSDKVERCGVAVIATVRTGEASAGELLARDLAARRQAALVELGRMSSTDVAAMVSEALGGPVPAEVSEVVASAADGLPLLVEELLAALIDAGALRREGGSWHGNGPVDVVVPRSFAAAVHRRLGRLEAPDRDVLLTAALLGERLDWRLLTRLPGVADVAGVLRRGAELQLLEADSSGEVRFRHALTRTALLATLLEPERVERAGQALSVLLAGDGRAEGGALELAGELAVLAGDERATRFFLDAAGAALGRGAIASARTAAARVLDLPGTGEDAIVAHELLVDAATLAGDAAAVVGIGERLLGRLEAIDAPPPRVAAAHLRLARAAVVSTDWRRAREHLAAADRIHPPARREVSRTLLAAQVALGEHRTGEALELALRVSAADGGVAPAARCEAFELLGRASRVTVLSDAERFFEQELVAAERDGLGLWRARALHELGTIDLARVGTVDRLQRAASVATGIGAPGLAAMADFHRSLLHFLRYELDAAEVAAAAARLAAGRHHLGLLEPLAVTVTASIRAVRADRAGAMSLAAEAEAGSDDEVQATIHGNALALAALCVEDRETARGELEAAHRLTPPASGVARSPYVGLLALLRALGGEAPPPAPAVETYLVPRALGELAQAVVRGRAGDGEGALAAASAGDAALRPAPWFRHVGRRLVAEAAIEQGWMDPVPWLRESSSFFDRAGLTELGGAVRSMLRRAGAPLPPGSASPTAADLARLGITRREEDVLALVAMGLSSREIATRLYLSPRTVEKHIQRLLQKTGAANRVQLAAMAPPIT